MLRDSDPESKPPTPNVFNLAYEDLRRKFEVSTRGSANPIIVIVVGVVIVVAVICGTYALSGSHGRHIDAGAHVAIDQGAVDLKR